MALRFNWKKNLPKLVWGVILLILILCLVKIKIWEDHYYAEKEGSTRAIAITATNAPADTTEEVNEEDITEQQKQAWRVAADRPRFLSIEKLGIDRARIVEIGVNFEGRLQTPASIFDVGWYRSSGKPGQGGVVLLDGHNGGPTKEGVFKHLPELSVGDIITIERGDGKFFRYEVIENSEVLLSDADAQMDKMLKPVIPGREGLSIITCTGVWSQVQQTYLSRQFLRAALIPENTNFEATEIKNELKEQREAKEKEELNDSTDSEN
ncbi:class F sortase [Candidatus Saccharibacteria bacterium]|nr:class F sortase [Candidatus Saccharibacteria bacterium]